MIHINKEVLIKLLQSILIDKAEAENRNDIECRRCDMVAYKWAARNPLPSSTNKPEAGPHDPAHPTDS